MKKKRISGKILWIVLSCSFLTLAIGSSMPDPTPAAIPNPEALPLAAPDPEPVAAPKPEAIPDPEPSALPDPEPSALPNPEALPEPKPSAEPDPEALPNPEALSESDPSAQFGALSFLLRRKNKRRPPHWKKRRNWKNPEKLPNINGFVPIGKPYHNNLTPEPLPPFTDVKNPFNNHIVPELKDQYGSPSVTCQCKCKYREVQKCKEAETQHCHVQYEEKCETYPGKEM